MTNPTRLARLRLAALPLLMVTACTDSSRKPHDVTPSEPALVSVSSPDLCHGVYGKDGAQFVKEQLDRSETIDERKRRPVNSANATAREMKGEKATRQVHYLCYLYLSPTAPHLETKVRWYPLRRGDLDAGRRDSSSDTTYYDLPSGGKTAPVLPSAFAADGWSALLFRCGVGAGKGEGMGNGVAVEVVTETLSSPSAGEKSRQRERLTRLTLLAGTRMAAELGCAEDSALPPPTAPLRPLPEATASPEPSA